MPLSYTQKEQVVETIAEQVGPALSVLIADATKTDTAAINDLRARARAKNINLRVIPNRLALLALKDSPHKDLVPFKGPGLWAWSHDSLSSPARLFRDYIKETESETIKVQSLSIGSGLIPGSELAAIASLPSREEALSMLASTLRAIPQKLAVSLNAIPTKLAVSLEAVRQERESSSS